MALTKFHENVFLVDGDMRRPQLHDVFGMTDRDEALMEVLLNENAGALDFERLPQKTEIDNIDIALGHPVEGASPTEVLATGRFKAFLDWARSRYGVVIIDSPPLGILSEAIGFGQMVDDVILVCRFDKARKHECD